MRLEPGVSGRGGWCQGGTDRLSALLTALLIGCGTTYVPQDAWTYSGNDESWRAPPRVPRGELSAAAWAAARYESENRWLQQRQEVIEGAKDTCARATATSKNPDYWFGYPRSFRVCMATQGWSVGGQPL